MVNYFPIEPCDDDCGCRDKREACPFKSALSMGDQHIVKIPVEITQGLVCAMIRHDVPKECFPLTQKGTIHKGGYKHHPIVKWLGDSYENFKWGVEYLSIMCAEYTRRFGKIHFAESQMKTIIKFDWSKYLPLSPDFKPTPMIPAVNQSKGLNLDLLNAWESGDMSIVELYREYYKRDKKDMLRYSKTDAPEWLVIE